MSIFSRRPKVYPVSDDNSYSYLRRADGRWIVTHMFGHSVVVVGSTYATEARARKAAEMTASIDRAQRRPQGRTA